MPYYRGDYVGGPSNYYRGDPFLGALVGGIARSVGLGKVAAKAARWVGQRITGSGLKRAAQVAGGTVAAAAGTAIVNRTIAGPSIPTMEPVELEVMPGGGGGGGMVGGGGGGTQWVVTPSGRRMRVRWSQTKGKWVAVRSMNPLNPKALNRALRRATGFEKFAKRTVNALYRTSTGATKSRKFKRK